MARIANKVALALFPKAIGFLIISSSYSGVSNTLHHNMFRIPNFNGISLTFSEFD